MQHGSLKNKCAKLGIFLGSLSLSLPSQAREIDAEQVEALRNELAALKKEQVAIAAKVSAIETAIDAIEEDDAQTVSEEYVQASVASAAPAKEAAGLQLLGDFRLRYERNFGQSDTRGFDRGVFRARLRARYPVTDRIDIGAEVVTGDPDDPNTADVTIANFVDDLQVNLSQLYASLSFQDIKFQAGKFPQPFQRTDLVWDGDVNPQGLAASYALKANDRLSVAATALYFLIDESVGGPDSMMAGGQVSFDALVSDWRVNLSGAYYDYRLNSLDGAGPGDIRSNLLTSDGTYLSDFDLVDIIARLAYNGLGERWPIHVIGNYVNNLGAKDHPHQGFSAEIVAGRTKAPGDWEISYGYLQTDVDAVFAAFSHDNFAIATNYKAHKLTLDLKPAERIVLNATLFSYRSLDPGYANEFNPADWRQRLRLNLTFEY